MRKLVRKGKRLVYIDAEPPKIYEGKTEAEYNWERIKVTLFWNVVVYGVYFFCWFCWFVFGCVGWWFRVLVITLSAK